MVLSRRGLAAGLLLGAALDAALADPRRGHPVAAFGRRRPGPRRRSRRTAAAAGWPWWPSAWPRQPRPAWPPAARPRPSVRRVAMTALATWAVLGGTSLAREAQAIGGSWTTVTWPPRVAGCPRCADATGPARRGRAGPRGAGVGRREHLRRGGRPAAVGAVLGLPGLLGYRAVNTLDAMIGHHSPRYERFGWAAARLDDAANLIPARVTGLLAAALAPAVGQPRHALRMLRRDSGNHPSPNAAAARRPSPGHWPSNWVARTSITARPSSAGSWATADRRTRPTSPGRSGCPGWSAPRPRRRRPSSRTSCGKEPDQGQDMFPAAAAIGGGTTAAGVAASGEYPRRRRGLPGGHRRHDIRNRFLPDPIADDLLTRC